MRVMVFIGLGGALGAIARHLVSTPINARVAPWGTVAVNVTGSALLGYLIGRFASHPIDPAVQTGLLVGVLGGFTTFSTFSAETVVLLQNGQWGTAAVNVAVSVSLALAAAAGGLALARTG